MNIEGEAASQQIMNTKISEALKVKDLTFASQQKLEWKRYST